MVPVYIILCFIYGIHGDNDFDTYNAECPRIRKSWLTLTRKEKDLYISGLMQLRKQGEGQMELDEFIAVGSEHQQDIGSIVHYGSTYLFWHGYLAWELESRIRNLGGEYSCFGLPYWDFSTETDRTHDDDIPFIFNNDIHGLGGTGDPNNYYTVNDYSWPGVTTKDFWVPAHCTADGDEFPMCSLKRSTYFVATGLTAKQTGAGIIDNPQFADFSRWYSSTINLPHSLLTNDPFLWEPVVTSYDPIWYLFHSMVSYHEAIWKNCHGYDSISPSDLDNFDDAYTEFCDAMNHNCYIGQGLDDPMFYGGLLQTHPWSLVSKQSLTVRKAYHLDRWNVKYDLTGDGFYVRSGLKDYCKEKLNKEWFINEDDAIPDMRDEIEDKELLSSAKGTIINTDFLRNDALFVGIIAVVIIFGLGLFLREFCLRNDKIIDSDIALNRVNKGYGSV